MVKRGKGLNKSLRIYLVGEKVAIDSNMRTWVNLILFDELAKCSDAMNLNGEDHKVYEFCLKDFDDYIGFVERNLMKVEPLEPDMILDGAVIGQVMSINLNPYALVFIQTQTSTHEVADFIHMWVQQWWKKWQTRVKISFDFPKEKMVMSKSALEEFTNDELNDIILNTKDNLIKYGEICFAQVLADNLFKQAVLKSQKRKWTTGDKVNLITELSREAKRLAYTHGPLIFVRPDSNLFKMREYRDDGRMA
jgi:hypothetical protein